MKKYVSIVFAIIFLGLMLSLLFQILDKTAPIEESPKTQGSITNTLPVISQEASSTLVTKTPQIDLLKEDPRFEKIPVFEDKIQISEGFYIANSKVFYKNPNSLNPTEIKSADPISFRKYKDSFMFAKDLKNVYCFDKVVNGADLETFVPIKNNDIDRDYAKDKYSVYYGSDKLLINADSFQVSFWGIKDGENVYRSKFIPACDYLCGIEKIDGADANSYKNLGNMYSKDRNLVYFGSKVLEDADPNTFVIIDKDKLIAKDSGHVFIYDSRIDGISSDGVAVVNNQIKNNEGTYSYEVIDKDWDNLNVELILEKIE